MVPLHLWQYENKNNLIKTKIILIFFKGDSSMLN